MPGLQGLSAYANDLKMKLTLPEGLDLSCGQVDLDSFYLVAFDAS